MLEALLSRDFIINVFFFSFFLFDFGTGKYLSFGKDEKDTIWLKHFILQKVMYYLLVIRFKMNLFILHHLSVSLHLTSFPSLCYDRRCFYLLLVFPSFNDIFDFYLLFPVFFFFFFFFFFFCRFKYRSFFSVLFFLISFFLSPELIVLLNILHQCKRLAIILKYFSSF